jgi:hypothetical protein
MVRFLPESIVLAIHEDQIRLATEIDYYEAMMEIANSQMSKEQLAGWLQKVTRGTPPEIE